MQQLILSFKVIACNKIYFEQLFDFIDILCRTLFQVKFFIRS